MTISEQIREVALYAEYPICDMSDAAFMECLGYRKFPQLMHSLNNTDCRTFILLVAEALK